MKKFILLLSFFCLFCFSLNAAKIKKESSIDEFSFEDYDCIRTEIDVSKYLDNLSLARDIEEYEKVSNDDSSIALLTKSLSNLSHAIENSKNYKYFEMNVDAVVKYNKETYKIQKCVAVSAKDESSAISIIKRKIIPKILSTMYEIPESSQKKIKVSKIKCSNTNKSEYKEANQRNNVYVNDIEVSDNIVWEFIGDISYQLEKDSERQKNATVKYQSKLRTPGVAFFDFQMKLIEYAKDNGYENANPIINSIVAYKLEYIPKAKIEIEVDTKKKEDKKAKDNTEDKKKKSKDTSKEEVKTVDDKNEEVDNKQKNDDLQLLIEMYKKGLIDDEEFIEAKKMLSN